MNIEEIEKLTFDDFLVEYRRLYDEWVDSLNTKTKTAQDEARQAVLSFETMYVSFNPDMINVTRQIRQNWYVASFR